MNKGDPNVDPPNSTSLIQGPPKRYTPHLKLVMVIAELAGSPVPSIHLEEGLHGIGFQNACQWLLP